MIWERITRRRFTPAAEDNMKRFIGCNVQLVRRNGVTVRGPLKDLNYDFITFEQMKPIMLRDGDDLFYDTEGPAPKTVYSAETKELARRLYSVWSSDLYSPRTFESMLNTDGQERWLKIADEAIKYVRGL
jgi:hypothetical protein